MGYGSHVYKGSVSVLTSPSRLRDGVGSARVGDEIPIWVASGGSCYNNSDTIASNFISVTSIFSRSLFDPTIKSSRQFGAGNQAEQTGGTRKPRHVEESGQPTLQLTLPDTEREIGALN